MLNVEYFFCILALFGSLICKPYSEGSSEMSLSSLLSLFCILYICNILNLIKLREKVRF